MQRKRVIYLLGAGSTQGEIKYVDDSILLLTKDVVDGIIKKIDKKNISILKEVKNELIQEADIEHLITLYESVGTNKHLEISKKLKELFREEIIERIKYLEVRNPEFIPLLTCVTIDMHEISSNKEKIVGILTVNYDDIVDRAIQNVKRGINYSIQIKNSKSKKDIRDDRLFPYIKLHGSFNWKKDYPLIIADQNNLNEDEVLWIPPGVEKNRKMYPFDLLWGKAKELLECDILRIIGCSLNRNDWQLVSLIFAIQKISSHKNFKIEIIDYKETGDKIRKNYPYLRVDTIVEIPEFREYLIEYSGIKDTDELPTSVVDLVSLVNASKVNIFEWWLRAKGMQLIKDPIIKSLSTKNSFFENFIRQISV